MIATDDDIDNSVSVTPARSDKAAPPPAQRAPPTTTKCRAIASFYLIYAGHEENGSAPVPVGVNGVVYYIPRARRWERSCGSRRRAAKRRH